MLRRSSPKTDDPGAPVRDNGARRRERNGREPEEENFREMELWEHLAELRTRLFRAIVYVCLGAVAGWFLYPPIVKLFQVPLARLAQKYAIYWAWRHATEPFFVQLKVSVIIGLAIALPLVLLEIWGFIAPGLTRRERRLFYAILPLIIFFFITGCTVGYLVLGPALEYFVSFLPPRAPVPTPGASSDPLGVFSQVNPMGIPGILIQNPGDYLMFIVKMILSFGIVFQMPVVLMAFASVGLINARMLAKQWRTAIVVMAIVAAVITPSGDAMTMSMMLAPLVLLYFGSIFLVKWVEVRRNRRR